MPAERERTLFYRRANWIDGNLNLQDLLRAAHQNLGTTADRTFGYHDGEIQGLAYEARDNEILFHVALYEPHQPTSLVPHPSRAAIKNTSSQMPPDRHDYMHGDIFFLVHRNHLIICPSGAREAVMDSYIRHVLRKTGFEDAVALLSLEAIADVNKTELIRREGVKNIKLEASLYEATQDYIERHTTKRSLMNAAAQEILALFANDNDRSLQEIREAENLMVRLEISYDSRRRGGEIGRRRIDETARRLIADNEDSGFKIETGSGKVLKAAEIRVSKKTRLTTSGNSVNRDNAWENLSQYLDELGDSGILEQ